MSSSFKIGIFVFSIILLFQFINSQCLKRNDYFDCNNSPNRKCCSGLNCRRRIEGYRGSYKCALGNCNKENKRCGGKDGKGDGCCYGFKCDFGPFKNDFGICKKCDLDDDNGMCLTFNCCSDNF
ncbi:hypothetical protein ACQ4LE_010211 [Meloidogyne hapla]|uniref:Uncharacterized protein n=1 Tax=Meloidogyne hapla TaxID=6305 RepID=A0A1I8BGD9_MELHA